MALMRCFNGVNSLMLAAHPALRHLQKDLGVKVEEGMKKGTRNSWTFPLKPSYEAIQERLFSAYKNEIM